MLAPLGYLTALGAYAFLVLWLLWSPKPNSFRLALACAALVMVAQSLVHMFWLDQRAWAMSEAVRSIGWILVLASLALPTQLPCTQRLWPFWALGGLALLEVLQIFWLLLTQTSIDEDNLWIVGVASVD